VSQVGNLRGGVIAAAGSLACPPSAVAATEDEPESRATFTPESIRGSPAEKTDRLGRRVGKGYPPFCNPPFFPGGKDACPLRQPGI